MRVAIYARCSTLHQSTDMQLIELREYARLRQFDIFREYVDVGVSGGKSDRPQLNELMADARKRRFDAVLCWKLDRFARSLRHFVMAMAEFEAVGVGFISQTEGIDSTTPAGRCIRDIIAVLAEFERALIRERVRAGVKRAIESGRKWGRKPAEIDLSKIPPGTTIRRAAELLGVNRESVRKAMRTKQVAESDVPAATVPTVGE